MKLTIECKKKKCIRPAKFKEIVEEEDIDPIEHARIFKGESYEAE